MPTAPPPDLHTCIQDKAHLADTEIAGSEVVGPLREAVGFVYTDKGHWGQLSEAGRAPGPSSN